MNCASAAGATDPDCPFIDRPDYFALKDAESTALAIMTKLTVADDKSD